MNLPLYSRPTKLRRAILLLAAGLLATGILACSHEEPMPLQPSSPSGSPVLAKGGETGVEWLVALEDGYTAEDVALATGWTLLESYPDQDLALFFDEDGEANKTPGGVFGIKRVEVNDRLIPSPGPIDLTTGFYEGDVEDDVYAGQEMYDLLELGEVHNFYRGAGIRVAIIDTGVDVDHPHLKTRLDFSRGDGPIAANDFIGHGTWIAGIIATVAPDADLVTYNVFGTGDETEDVNIAEAVGRAHQDGVDIINLSIRLNNDSPVLELMIQEAEAAGIMVIAAAGNTNGGSPVFPGTLPETVSIAAVSTKDEISDFSAVSTGDDLVDFAAFGEGIYTTSPGGEEHPDGGYAYVSGTSMSCAVGTGVFALGLEAFKATHSPADIVAMAATEAVDVDPIGAVIHGRFDTRFLFPRIPGGPIIPR